MFSAAIAYFGWWLKKRDRERQEAEGVRQKEYAAIRIGCGHDDPFKLPQGSLGHLPQCAAAIRSLQPDVVGLQEVDNGNPRTWRSDQTAELAKLCGMEGAWVEKVPGYGISVLFRRKPLKVTKTLIPGKVHTRALLVAEFEDCIVANTHFPLTAETCANAARHAP